MLYSNQSGGSSIAPTAEPAKEASPLAREINTLTDTINNMEKLLGVLHDRLEPVRLPTQGKPSNEKVAGPQASLAKAPDWVRTQRQRLQDFNGVIAQLLDELQV
jgi:hypothetical protein